MVESIERIERLFTDFEESCSLKGLILTVNQNWEKIYTEYKLRDTWTASNIMLWIVEIIECNTLILSLSDGKTIFMKFQNALKLNLFLKRL